MVFDLQSCVLAGDRLQFPLVNLNSYLHVIPGAAEVIMIVSPLQHLL